jgi:putative spermidine/putrescine transport system substrate-binding protein
MHPQRPPKLDSPVRSLVGRRSVIAGLGATSLASMAAGAFPALASAPRLERELSLIGPRGSFRPVWDAKIVAPFERRYDCHVASMHLDSIAAVAKVMTEMNAPVADVVSTGDLGNVQGRMKGLFAPLDFADIPNAKRCYGFARSGHGVGIMWGLSGTVLEYSAQHYADHHLPRPKGFSDLWKPGVAGHVGLFDLTSLQGINTFLMLNRIAGGDESNYEPGFAFLKTHPSSLVETVSLASQMDILLQQGTVWLTVNSNARANLLKAKGVPVEIAYPLEGVAQMGLHLNVVKGARHPRLAHRFIDWVLSPQIQALIGAEMLIGPVVPGLRFDPAVASRLIYGPERVSKLVRPNFERVVSNLPDLLDWWNKELAPEGAGSTHTTPVE